MLDRYRALRQRAYNGAIGKQPRLTAEEIAVIADELQQAVEPRAQILLLDTLGYAGGPQYRHVVEPFLAHRDPEVARAALWVLCDYWLLASQYVPQLLAFIRGLPSDVHTTLQVAAMGFTNDYLTATPSGRVLRGLIAILGDPTANEYGRDYAQQALRVKLRDGSLAADPPLQAAIQEALAKDA